jgi:hypothetical protein
MPLSATERIQFYQIAGIPTGGGGLILTSLVHVPFSNTQNWEPTYNVGDFTALVTAIDAKLTAASADAVTRLQSLITRYMEIEVSPVKVNQTATGAAGVIADHSRERENIRQTISNVIGMAIPEGGFISEVQRTYGKSMARWVSSVNDR